jgi:hypothetical protein
MVTAMLLGEMVARSFCTPIPRQRAMSVREKHLERLVPLHRSIDNRRFFVSTNNCAVAA